MGSSLFADRRRLMERGVGEQPLPKQVMKRTENGGNYSCYFD